MKSKELLGLPAQHIRNIKKIVPHQTALFLFNYSRRTLHGVFEATEPGAMNLDPDAWTSASGYVQGAGRHYGKNGGNSGGSPFPAQVRFHVVHAFPPLPESKFKHIVTYKGSNQFEFMLSADQVEQIMTAFIAEQERVKQQPIGRR